MWIKEIALDDFGCFDHARIGGLQNGVNVIAGPQRAGKTTFMQALRHLGYKIPRDGSVPPAANEYSLGATVMNTDGEYRLDISGYGEPSVSPTSDAPDCRAAELYAGLQKTQYHQVYTISLDELRESPRHLDSDVGLAEVLLGGAFGDVVQLPQLRDSFESEASRIGGKHGRASYELRDPVETIEAGIEERDTATAQVDEYEDVEAEVQEITTQLRENDAERTELLDQQSLLEALEECYDEVERLRDVRTELSDVDEDQVEQFPGNRVDTVKDRKQTFEHAQSEAEDTLNEFEAAVSLDDVESYLAKLSDRRPTIERYENELSGYRERLSQLREEDDLITTRWNELRNRASTLNDEWTGDLNAVRDVDTDRYATDTMRCIVEEYREARREHEEVKTDLADARRTRSSLEVQLDELNDERSGENDGVSTIVLGGGAFAGLVVGILSGIVGGAVVGVLVTFAVLSVIGAIALRNTDDLDTTETAIRNLESDIRSVDAEVEQYERKIRDAEATLESASNEFEDLCNQLGIPTSMSPQAVQDFHSDLRDLQSNLADLEQRESALAADKDEFRSEIESVVEELVEVGSLDSHPEDPLEDANRVFSVLEQTGAHAELAQKVNSARKDARTAESRLFDALSDWSGVPENGDCDDHDIESLVTEFLDQAEEVEKHSALLEERDSCQQHIEAHFSGGKAATALTSRLEEAEAAVDGGDIQRESTVHSVAELAREYDDREEIGDRLDEIEQRLDAIEEEQEELRGEKADLNQRLDSLRSAEDVEDAHETIHRGRHELVPLAEEYAVNRLAEHFLDELYERYIDRTTGPLLAEASDVFERMTDGEYASIVTDDDIEDLDFVTLLSDGDSQTPAELSRATVEQLFLAIRIARIRQESQPLPVILDDSFTNFDPGHRQRTLQVVSELADENQVFLLTCHPEIIDAVPEATTNANCWSLQDGVFDGSVDGPGAKAVLETK